ncbi:MAG: hypothetical protein L6437_07000, partial [Kiritimatiellae bacterium]|nr:hypothetical protein [Kiritimatiellia bacterium]
PLPAPIDNVTIQFKTPVKKVWFATARPGPVRVVNMSPDELWKIALTGFGVKRTATQEWYGPMRCDPASPADGKVVLPQLRVWTMVVAEMQ